MIDIGILGTSAYLGSALIVSLGAYSQYVVQRAGFFSTSPVAFIAIGAYASTYLSMRIGMPIAAAVLLTLVLCGLLGALLGRLVGKLRGAYVAIATLSVVLVVQQVAMVWDPVTGGPLGITGIPVWATPQVLLLLVAVMVVAMVGYELSGPGRRQASLRMDEVAAASVGINVARGGIVAMAVSSVIGGLAGAATAGNLFAIEPTGFGFSLVVTTLSAVIIGGYRSPIGPLAGAFAIVALPLVFSGYALVAGSIVGIVTIVSLRFFPRGLAGLLPFDSQSLVSASRWLPARLPGGGTPDAADTGLRVRDRGVLSAVSIARSYGSVKAVQDVSLEVSPGRISGLIGPNGAGKTSVINLLAGVAALDSGTVMLGEREIHTLPAFRLAHSGIARTFQACRLFSEMSVLDNVMLAAASGRARAQRAAASDGDVAAHALAIAGYQGPPSRLADQLSYADQRRVEIARALALEPSFLLLDEPAAGMTESESTELAAVLRTVAGLGIGVLVIDHNVNWIFSVCDHVSVQHLGAIIATGPPDVVRNDPSVIEAYTGTAPDPQGAG